MSSRLIRGIVGGIIGSDDVIDSDSDVEFDSSEVDYEDGDIVISSDELHSIAYQNKDSIQEIHNDWNNLSESERNNQDPEEYAKNWLGRNLQNVSDNTLVILISIFGGIILSSTSVDAYISNINKS